VRSSFCRICRGLQPISTIVLMQHGAWVEHVRPKAAPPRIFHADASSGTVQQVRIEFDDHGSGGNCGATVGTCFLTLSSQVGIHLQLRQAGIQVRHVSLCPPPIPTPYASLDPHPSFSRTHASIAATAVSDFVTDAAGVLDAHDVARVLLALRSRCCSAAAEHLFSLPFAHAVTAAEAIWTAGGLNIPQGSMVFKVCALFQTRQSPLRVARCVHGL
jgi:hypothetical protein